jgi:hypothetical protein
MPTIDQLPLATDIGAADQIPISQGGVSRAVTVGSLLENTQEALTLATGSLLGRVSNGPGGPESIALGTGLQIQNDVLLVDHSAYPQVDALATSSTMLLNSNVGTPQLMPISLLRGLYTAGQNITIDSDGTIHSTPAAATGASIGAVAVGDALVINASGQLSVNVGTVSGTVAAGDDVRITAAEQTTNKNKPNGYAGLDSSGLVPVGILPPNYASAVETVAGRTGNVVLTTADIGGLGSIATQNANAASITGGRIAGADTSGALATPSLSGASARSLAGHFADSVNVNDFGLARDGVTDDSQAFVAACQTAMAAQKSVYIPAGGPILLTDHAQQNLSNVSIHGDGIRDYDSAQGYGREGSTLWFTGQTKSPFLLGPNVQFHGLTFFWPNQTETATTSNNNLPMVYPPLFAQQSPAQNIVYFNFVDCQVTNCYDFFTAVGTVAVVGGCTVERCIIYAIRNCFTLQNVPEVFFIANSLFTWGVYGTVVSVGPTYNLRSFTNTQGSWLKVVGDGTATKLATSTVGGIMSCNTYVFGASRGIWLAGGTLDISAFINTSFDNVPTVLQGDTGCAMFSTRFTGGAWYPIYFTQAGNPDCTAIQINNPAPGGVGLNVSFSAITIPFINGSLAAITGSNISNLSFSDIRCNAFGHTSGGAGPYYGFQFNTPNANIRVIGCDLQASYAGLTNTGVQVTACAEATIADCVIRNCSAPIDIETASGLVTLSGNITQSTQGTSPVVGVGTTNVRDLGNVWDQTNFVYNGFAPNNYRPGATIGVMPVASTAGSGYLGIQPSAVGSTGGTRFGLTAVGNGAVSLLTNAFNEEQMRINRQVSAVNYVAVHGSVSGQPSLITTGGSDTKGILQVCGLTTGATLLGSAGVAGSPVVRLGAIADQSYIGSAPGNGFSLTVPANCSTVLLKPAATLATGSMVLPVALADGEKIEIWSSKTITSLTVSGSGGALVNNGSGFQLGANATVAFFWNAANNSWFQSLGSGTANGSISSQNADNVAITGGSIVGLAQFAVGNDAAVSASVVLDAAAGYARQVVYETASLPRWVVGVQGTPEDVVAATMSSNAPIGASNLALTDTTGIAVGMLVAAAGIVSGTTVTAINSGVGVRLSQPTTIFINSGSTVTFYTNQGSDFAILPYDDTGAPLAPTLGQPLLITRATGQVTIKTLLVNGTANVPTPLAGDNSTQVATTAFVGNAILTTSVPASKIGAPNGVASLDGTGRVPAAQLPATAQGALDYQGAWNAATNTPALASGVGTQGMYYTVSTAGSTILDGIGQWNAGDHAAFNGTVWEKFDGLASEVLSVAGRTGSVVLSSSDVAGLGSLASQSGNAVAITGGTIDATTIGATTPAAGTFTTLSTGATLTLGTATLATQAYAGIVVQGGAAILGSTRGLGAFDGQQYRTGPSQIASGQYAVQFGTGNTTSAVGSISIGGSNTVSGSTGYAGAFGGSNAVTAGYAFAFGNSHTLAGTYGHAFGFKARDFGRYGISLLAGGANVSNGDAQRSEVVLRATSTAAAAVRLTADGSTAGSANSVNLQNNQVAKLNVEIVGFNATGNTAATWFARDVLLGRGSSASSMALSSATLTAGGAIGSSSGWTAPTIAVDTTNGGLAIQSGYAAATSIKWVARVVAVEVM